MTGEPGSSAVLAFAGVTRRFGRLIAVNEVSLGFERGEIHAILGENGAGKSTLVHMAAGLLEPDSGEVLIHGCRTRIAHPADAEAHEIGMVHQHFTLVEAMTVAENLALSHPPNRFRRGRLEREARSLMEQVGFDVDPRARVGDLSVGERQRVEILKAQRSGRSVLILDEPTAVLSPLEAEALFQQLRTLADQGRAVILITHRLPEVRRIADRVSVLRRGRVVHQSRVSEVSDAQLAATITGEEVGRADGVRDAAPGPCEPGPAALSVRQLRGDSFGPVDLTVHAGEIVGVAGVAGNGQTALAETLAGLRSGLGEIEVHALPRAFVSGDRRGTSLALDLSVIENTVLREDLLKDAWFSREQLQRAATPLLERFAVRCDNPHGPVRWLSGGNQQKVVLARELHETPGILIAENPTRGLDLGAVRFVHDELRRARSQGSGILLFSTDLDEILELADRIFVAFAGQLWPSKTSVEEIARLMVGMHPGEEPPA